MALLSFHPACEAIRPLLAGGGVIMPTHLEKRTNVGDPSVDDPPLLLWKIVANRLHDHDGTFDISATIIARLFSALSHPIARYGAVCVRYPAGGSSPIDHTRKPLHDQIDPEMMNHVTTSCRPLKGGVWHQSSRRKSVLSIRHNHVMRAAQHVRHHSTSGIACSAFRKRAQHADAVLCIGNHHFRSGRPGKWEALAVG